jgi:hypothetical protein
MTTGTGVGLVGNSRRVARASFPQAEPRPPRRLISLTLLLLLAATVSSLAQRGGFQGGFRSYSGNQRYDGKFVFVRVSYDDPFGRGRPHWSHDYPDGEEHFMRILDAVTTVSGHIDEHNIMGLDDPEIFKFPVLYMAEPGYWGSMTDAQVAALRAHLLKGGFIIFDDFGGGPRRNPNDWGNLEMQMGRVFPELHWIDVPPQHPIFHTFYEIADPANIPQYYDSGPAIYRAIFEDNDPNRRIMAFANFNTDISEFWEWSGTGYRPVDETNEAYKVGVNEFIYAIVH